MGIHCPTCKCHPPKSTGHVDCPRCTYPTAKSFIDEHPLHVCEQCAKQMRIEEKQQAIEDGKVIELRDGRGGRHE